MFTNTKTKNGESDLLEDRGHSSNLAEQMALGLKEQNSTSDQANQIEPISPISVTVQGQKNQDVERLRNDSKQERHSI